MVDRVMGVLRLDSNTFEEVEADTSATSQAAIIVVLVALLSGIGSGVGADNFVLGFLGAAAGALLGWVVWSGVTYFIGTNLFGGQADIGEMLRVIGFAQAPGMLNVLGFIPVLGGIIALIAAIWSLIAGFIAIRQGLDIDNVKTLITVVLGWIAAAIVIGLLTALIGGTAAGLGALLS